MKRGCSGLILYELGRYPCGHLFIRLSNLEIYILLFKCIRSPARVLRFRPWGYAFFYLSLQSCPHCAYEMTYYSFLKSIAEILFVCVEEGG